ncbi:hypothetical protein Salat_2549200 [Sesamum alatum]|uniref:Uncharacterized protein n=1 Tax=Sesamum alatum TaxID=300844 RepID=A0AAE1XSN1_9LAMI|nr:hypothetical protein Salat_2549200 [Sesamum alatum]
MCYETWGCLGWLVHSPSSSLSTWLRALNIFWLSIPAAGPVFFPPGIFKDTVAWFADFEDSLRLWGVPFRVATLFLMAHMLTNHTILGEVFVNDFNHFVSPNSNDKLINKFISKRIEFSAILGTQFSLPFAPAGLQQDTSAALMLGMRNSMPVLFDSPGGAECSGCGPRSKLVPAAAN